MCRALVLLLIAVMIVGAGGCATVTFKRGAGPEAMSVDEKACRGATSDEQGYLDCMRNRGWFVAVTGPGASAGTTEPTPPAVTAPPVIATPTPTTAPVISAPVAATPATPDSLPRVRVASWWKLGGTAADLDHAIAACVTQLGEPHKPDANATVVTVAMQSCLREAGWYALTAPGH